MVVFVPGASNTPQTVVVNLTVIPPLAEEAEHVIDALNTDKLLSFIFQVKRRATF